MTMKNKKTMIYILLIMILSQPLLAEKIWVNKEEAFAEHINALECSDSSNCFAFSESVDLVIVYKSTDQGDTWNIIYEEENGKDLYDIGGLAGGHVLDANNIYILDDQKVGIDKSTDGGETFKPIRFGELSTIYDYFFDICMYDEKLGAGTTLYNLIITKDNWNTYEFFKLPTYGADYKIPSAPLFFIDSNNIAMVNWGLHSDNFVKYNINEDEWTEYSKPIEELPDTAEQKAMLDLVFVTDSIAYTCGNQRVNETGDFGRDLIWKTTDKGKTWDLKYNYYKESTFGTRRLSFYNEKIGMAVGSWGKIIETTDGGDTWTYHDNLPNDIENTIGVNVAYAGTYPIISTWQGGIYRYEELDLSSKDESILDENQIKIRQTNEKLLISIEDDKFREYNIQIFDINGNVLKEVTHRSGIGTVFRPIRLDNLTNGIYFYLISANGQTIKTGKFSVIK